MTTHGLREAGDPNFRRRSVGIFTRPEFDGASHEQCDFAYAQRAHWQLPRLSEPR
jgi:hypothetical protein